jgi:adenylate cyclase
MCLLRKFITSYLRPLGMFLIFIFAALSIIVSIIFKEIDSSTALGTFIDYTLSFENRFYDYRMRKLINPNYKSKEIVLVKIDDFSLQKLGIWPIPRTDYALLLKKLKHFGTKVVAMDILFPEKSPHFNNQNPDEIFIEAIKDFQQEGRRIFLSYVLAVERDEVLKETPLEMLNDAIMTRNHPERDMVPSKIAKFTFPIEEYVSSEVGLGYISIIEDRDGIFRQISVVANIDSIYYGSLGFNSYEAFTGKKETVKVFEDSSGEVEINGKKLEISKRGETKIRYLGSEDQFPDVSLVDVLNAKENDPQFHQLFKNKIVFVGSTALGAHDLRPSPIDNKMPGVYAHMNLTQMLLDQYFYKKGDESVNWSIGFLIAGMVMFMIIQRRGNPFLDATMIIFLLIISYFIDQNYFLPQGYELKLFYCYFCFLTSYSWNTFIRFYEANKEKQQIKGTFSRYVPTTIVEEMLKDPSKLQIGGTKMDITCLFSDVRDFTSISEGLSPGELSHSLNLYMSQMTDIVFDTKGTLDKYIGDAIVAIWGAPLEIGNHAQFAVSAAVKMMERLPQINEEFQKLGRPLFQVGIGLNSGDCAVGNMGSDRIFSYTALGDNMNLGARLEGLCKYYGTQILISEETFRRLDQSLFHVRPIDKVVVKGKTLPVLIYEVLHAYHWMSQDQEILNFYLKGYQLFEEKKFAEAKIIFQQILIGNENDKPSKRILQLCEKFLTHPDQVDDHFDITVMKEK